MANTITNVLPKLLAQGLLALRENAIMPRLVNRSYDGLAASKGNVINIPIPSAIAARDVTPSVTYNSNVDFNPTVAVVTLDFWKEAPFQLSDSDMASVMDGTIPMQASEAIKSLGNAIDSYILGKHTGIYGYVGTAGTTPFNGSLTVAANARKVLNQQLAPLSDRRAVIDPSAETNLLLNTQVLQFDQSGEQGGIINGTIGTKLGLDWYMDQNITTFTPGTGWVTGWALSTVGAAAGDTTLNIINATASGTIKVGDIFTVNGSTQTYAVYAAATASATVQVAISFRPSLVTAATTGAAITVVATAYTVNLAFHRDAFAWASRPLADMMAPGSQIQSAVDPVTGVALRLEVSRQYKQTTFSFDVLGGANLIRPQLAVKIAG